MAYAALLSGITLAQVGLGSVHGLAAPLGAFFPIPHGVACGTLLEAATGVNIEAMAERDPANPALARYARAGRLLGSDGACGDVEARTFLLQVLRQWTERMRLPRGRYPACHITARA
jgi:alcohol dehydrogenase